MTASHPKRVRRLREDEVAALVAAYKAGDSTYVLARRYGVGRETVSRHLEHAGIFRRGRTGTQSQGDPRPHGKSR